MTRRQGELALDAAPSGQRARRARDDDGSGFATQPSASSGKSELALFALCLLLVRGALLFSLADVFLYGEELEKGAVAKLLLQGFDAPWSSLPYHIYEGGGFVQSHLVALAFAVLGPSMLALKTVPLAWNLLLLALGWRLLDGHFSRWSARAFAVLFVCAPISYQKLSLLSLGIHFEALTFLLAIAYCTISIASAPRGSPWIWLGLGWCVGFGWFFSYQTAVFAGAAGLLLAFTSWREFNARGGLLAFVGALIGSLPWWIMFAHWGPRVLDVHGAELGSSPSDAWARIRACWDSVFAGRDALDLAALGLLWAAPFSLLVLAWRSRSARGARAPGFLLLCLLAFLVAYLTSGFAVAHVYHYFLLNRGAPAWMLATLAAAVCLGQAGRSHSAWPRALAGFALGLLALAGLRGTYRACALGEPRTPLANLALLSSTKGYDYPAYFARLWPRLGLEDADKVRLLRSVREPSAIVLDHAIAEASAVERERSMDELTELARPRRATFLRGLGAQFDLQGAHSIGERAAVALSMPPSDRADVLEAVGRFGTGFSISRARLEQEFDSGIELGLPAEYFKGLGWRVYRCKGDLPPGAFWRAVDVPFAFSPRRARACLDTMPAPQRAWVEAGYLEAVREFSLGG